MKSPTRVPHLPRPSRISGYLAARLGPPVIEAAMLRDVLDRYDLCVDGAARNLRMGRRSRNVSIPTDRGPKVVKLYRPQWRPAAIRYGHSILLRLQESGFPTAHLCRTPDGSTWVAVGDGLFSVFDFVEGTNYSLNFLRRADRLRLTALSAETLAHLHRHLEGFEPSGQHHLGFSSPTGDRVRDLAWHVRKVGELTRRSTELDDEDTRERARQLTELASPLLAEIAELETLLLAASLPRLVIHGDFGLHNLIFRADGSVVPLDFEVARLDWRVNDLISALGKYRYGGNIYDLESMETFLRAYAVAFPLAPVELSSLSPAWRLYRLRAAVQYWSSYFETDGPTRKLDSALQAIDQARWIQEHPEAVERLTRAATEGAG